MDKKIQQAQTRVLRVVAGAAPRFALAGGTALERYYLHHRFSWDLDFFSPDYDLAEIDRLVRAIQTKVDQRLSIQSDLSIGGRARLRVYSMPVRGASRPLKIDFVEEVLMKKPAIKTFDGVRVYSAESIYLQKVAAVAGVRAEIDAAGRSVQQGRQEPRDAFDLYTLSKTLVPLHQFLAQLGENYQKGMVHWYRTFSRHDMKLGLLDIDCYDADFDSREMIAYLESEIRLFAKGVLEL